MLLTMLDNNTMQSLLRIPSHSSGPACPMLELDDFIFTRSGSAPISNEEDFNATRHSTQFVSDNSTGTSHARPGRMLLSAEEPVAAQTAKFKSLKGKKLA